jgi:hypothetical protein
MLIIAAEFWDSFHRFSSCINTITFSEYVLVYAFCQVIMRVFKLSRRFCWGLRPVGFGVATLGGGPDVLRLCFFLSPHRFMQEMVTGWTGLKPNEFNSVIPQWMFELYFIVPPAMLQSPRSPIPTASWRPLPSRVPGAGRRGTRTVIFPWEGLPGDTRTAS